MDAINELSKSQVNFQQSYMSLSELNKTMAINQQNREKTLQSILDETKDLIDQKKEWEKKKVEQRNNLIGIIHKSGVQVHVTVAPEPTKVAEAEVAKVADWCTTVSWKKDAPEPVEEINEGIVLVN